MSTDDEFRYQSFLLEEMREHFRVLGEALGDVRRSTVMIPAMEQNIRDLKDDVKAVKAAVTDLSREVRELRNDVNDHEQRITRLQAA